MPKKITDAQTRNEKIIKLMRNHFSLAENKKYKQVSNLKADLNLLFSTDEWGFREIVLMIALAKLHDSTYNPAIDLYACHPRSLYEKAIRPELTTKKIPSRQSGPLNIAKGLKRLDEAWAEPRKPAAMAVVRIIKKINTFNHHELINFTTWIHSEFLKVANITAALTFIVPPESNPVILSQLCRSLIEKTPDMGNTPQRIVGYLIETYHEEAETGVMVKGHLDRASTTSTTSKKPGDISEYSKTNKLLAVYEVTVKGFTQQRVQEAYEALVNVLDKSSLFIPTITVLCRPCDKHPEAKSKVDAAAYLGEYEYESLCFFFIDLFQWITLQLLRLTVSGRKQFYQKLEKYISDHNTAINVKMHWRDLRTKPSIPKEN